MNILPVEKQIGIETFFTKCKGVGGRLRVVPDDFIVSEIAQLPPPSDKGIFTIARVTSKNWETNHLIQQISKQLHISRKRISFAGTKDKRAKTTQIMSFYNVPPRIVQSIRLKNVIIDEVYQSDLPLRIGDLQGNHFEILIRDIPKDVTNNQIHQIFTSLESIGGFPNFFGVQRFGVIRPITHLVGKYMVAGDFKQAVMIYLTWLDETEDNDAYSARKDLLETFDFRKALHAFPLTLRFERAMTNHLVQYPTDYVGALQTLPKNLLTMFVYAYQSYLFNKMLSRRIIHGLPLNQAIVGDIILPVRQGQITDEEIRVTEENLGKVNKQLKRGKAYVSGVLIGSDVTFAEGEMGEIERGIIDAEGVDPRDFIIPEIPLASSYGTRRILLAPVKNLSYSLTTDSLHLGRQAMLVSFDLLKGCYATSFLREVMKADDIRKY